MSNKSGIASQVLSLPTGGGAVAGIGETFSPDLFTGTGNLSVPLELPPGRNGLAPKLALGYSSGTGNGPFGLGWQLSVPGVSRKTSRGIPRYRDGTIDPTRRDVFVLSGAEDLVPVGSEGPVERFRPRVEGLFARIERDRSPGSDVWRVRSRDGLVSVYGTPGRAGDDPACVADPSNPARVFGWRLSQTTDPLGNRIEYEHLRDGGQLYLRRVRYVDYQRDGQPRFLVSVTFTYEQRPDAFTDCRAGFQVRTRLRCRRIEVHTHAAADLLVRSYELGYSNDGSGNGISLLRRVQVVGHDGAASEALPPLDLDYSRFGSGAPDIRPLSAPGGSLPAESLDGADLELVSLFGNGLPDLVQLDGAARFWRNRGDGTFDAPQDMPEVPAVVQLADPGVQLADLNGNGRTDLLAQQLGGYFPLGFLGRWRARDFVRYEHLPSVDLAGPDTRLMDLDGDGVVDALRTGAQPGFELYFNSPTVGWSRVETRPPLPDRPDLSLADPRVKLADLNGDGLQDLVLVDAGVVSYWPYLGHGQWGRRVTMDPTPDGLPPPGEVFDPARVLFGDVDGDGLDDLVYVEPRRVTIWINQGGNGWSAPIVVSDTPLITEMDAIRLADVYAGGAAGLLWTAETSSGGEGDYQFLDLTDGHKPYLLTTVDNNRGVVTHIGYASSTAFLRADHADEATRWRTPLPFPVPVVAQVNAVDRISGGTLTTRYRYHHGYWDGVDREFRGFGMVEQLDTETFDATNQPPGVHHSPPTLTKTWFHLGPVAAAEADDWTELDLGHEYWPDDAPMLPRPAKMTAMLAALPRRARREALRALRGQTLRSELYALDGTDRQHRPYTVTEMLAGVREEAPPAPGDPARERIFFAFGIGQRSTQWERGIDPMTQFAFTAEPDAYGLATRQLAVAVPRRRDPRDSRTAPAQPYLATTTTTEYARRDDTERYIVDRVARSSAHEVLNDGTPNVFELRDAVLAGPAGARVSLRTIGHSRTFYDGEQYVGLPLGQLGEHGLPVRSESLAFDDGFLDEHFDPADPLALGPRPAYLDPSNATPWDPEYPDEFQALVPELAGYVHYDDTDVPGSPGGYYTVDARHRYDVHDPHRVPRGLPLGTLDVFGAESLVVYDEHDLLPAMAVDPAGLITIAEHDLRVLRPRRVTDPNGNSSRVTYSPAGFVTARFVNGKNGEGDATVPGVRMDYDLMAFAERGQPVQVRTTARVHHDTDTDVPAGRRDEEIVSVEYSDGFGRLLQTRTQAEDVLFGDTVFGGGALSADQTEPVTTTVGRARQPGAPDTVIVSGWQVYDNKGRVVEKYEPFFATGYDFRPPVDAELGMKATFFYDPRGQAIRTVDPDGSEQLTVSGVPIDLADPDVFAPTPWESFAYDANDNAGRTHPATAESYRSHWNTPTSTEVDALGRPVAVVARNGPDDSDWFVTRTTYDIQGNVIAHTDALDRPAFHYRHDIAGRRWRLDSIDAGRRDTIPDALGNPVESRDAKGAFTIGSFDVLHRPIRLWARDAAAGPVTLRQRIDYGDAGDPNQPAAEREAARADNLLGVAIAHYDEAGLVTVADVDFKANVVGGARRMVADAPILDVYRRAAANRWQVMPFVVDWQPVPGQTLAERAAELLDAVAYRTTTRFDALNRPVLQLLPSDVEGRRRELRPVYNRAGGLEQVRLDDTLYVERIAYNAKGQRTLIAYGNGVMTRFSHDPATFRLTRMRSERYIGGGLTYRPTGEPIQDYGYDYDLAGNIVAIRDRTPESGVPNNPDALTTTDPTLGRLLIGGNALNRRFTYDAIYRLVTATGRECDVPPDAPPWVDQPRGTDLTRARAYTENYRYDAVGGLLELIHASGAAGFTREFTVDPARNQLQRLHVRQDRYVYTFDAAGNMTSETSTRHFDWNHADQLAAFGTQTDNSEPSVHAQYLYDAAGERVKKLVRKQGGQVEVTHYLGGFEHHRWSGTSSSENNLVHITDDQQRIALARLGPPHPDDRSPAVQFQLGDHLGSSTVVVDEHGNSTNREEFTPYGETSFSSVARKRYRYSGKERDEESGLAYHGARYLHPALGRWLSCDPVGPAPSASPYCYCLCSPICAVDPGGLWPRPPVQDAIDGAIDHLDRADDPWQVQGKKGMREVAVTMDIDERGAVGAKDITPQEARARALDVNARQFLDPATNRHTKGVGVDTHAAPIRPAVSVAQDPNALLNRKFGEISEMRNIFDEAVAKITDPGKLKPTELKNKINSNIWAIIKTGNSESAVKVRQAFTKLGFENVQGQGMVMKAHPAGPNTPQGGGGGASSAGGVGTAVGTGNGRNSQRGSVSMRTMVSIAGTAGLLLLDAVIKGELPNMEDVADAGVSMAVPYYGLMKAKDHGETVLPILCICLPKVCMGAGLAVAGGALVKYEAEKAAEIGYEIKASARQQLGRFSPF